MTRQTSGNADHRPQVRRQKLIGRRQTACLADDGRSVASSTSLVRLDVTVIGTQGLKATNFAVTREVSSGSWITRRLQGQGFSAEIRAAAPQFAFDHLGTD